MKLARVLQKVFGSEAPSNQIGKFGSLASGTPETTDDPAVIQSLSNYLSGWYGAVIGNNSPAIEDRNALDFLFSYQLAYILQNGIAEWNTGTEYHSGAYVQIAGAVFISLSDDNTGNNPLTDAANWKSIALQNASSRNYLRNSQFRVVDGPDGTAFAASDGEINLSHWIALSGDDDLRIDIESVHNTLPLNNGFTENVLNIHSNVQTGTRFFGMFQMLDRERTSTLWNKVVNFRSYLSLTGAAGQELRIGIVKWTGTSDQYNRDPVDVWASTPTLKTDFEFVAISDPFDPDPGATGIDGFTQNFISETIPTDAKNIGVMIWTNTSIPGSAFDPGFRMGFQSLQIGAFPTAAESCQVSHEVDIVDKQRFYWGTTYGGVTDDVYIAGLLAQAVADTVQCTMYAPVEMYKVPSFTYESAEATSGGAEVGIATTLSASFIGRNFFHLTGSAPGFGSIQDIVIKIRNPVFDARLGV